MIVVADTSVLLNLSRVDQIDLLRALFGNVMIPPEVAVEFTRAASKLPRFAGLTLPSWVCEKSPTSVPEIVSSARGLDPGESSALALAAEISAAAILLDERRAYRVAVELGLKAIGVLGILLQAKSSGLIRELAPLLDRLEDEGDFWISENLRRVVLERAGE